MGCGGRDGGGADARFIGKEPPGNAVAGGEHQRGAGRAAEGCPGGEGMAENQPDGRHQGFPVDDKEQHTACGVEAAEKGNDLHTHISDGADASHDHKPREDCGGKARHMGI